MNITPETRILEKFQIGKGFKVKLNHHSGLLSNYPMEALFNSVRRHQFFPWADTRHECKTMQNCPTDITLDDLFPCKRSSRSTQVHIDPA